MGDNTRKQERQTMGIIKLPNVGDTHTMHVTLCEQVTGTYGEQVKFSDGTDTLFLPQSSADQQLRRIFGDEFSYIDACGNALTFSRSPNNKRPGASPYWNIAPASPAPSSSGKRMAPPVTEVVGSASQPIATSNVDDARRRIAESYLSLYKLVRATIDDDASAAQAATATIWITWNQRGIQPDGTSKVARNATDDDNAAPPIKHPTPTGKRLAPPEVPNELPPASKYDDDLPF
jgi:hypothetical protein